MYSKYSKCFCMKKNALCAAAIHLTASCSPVQDLNAFEQMGTAPFEFVCEYQLTCFARSPDLTSVTSYAVSLLNKQDGHRLSDCLGLNNMHTRPIIAKTGRDFHLKRSCEKAWRRNRDVEGNKPHSQPRDKHPVSSWLGCPLQVKETRYSNPGGYPARCLAFAWTG